MGEIKIVVKPFQMLSILSYTGVQEVNEHGYVEITGMIQADRKDEYIQKAMKETWVQILIYDEEGDEKPLFCGILADFKIKFEADSYILKLVLYTGTRLMDYKKHVRSFQKEGYTYKQAADLCNEDYDQSGMIMTEGKHNSLPGFVMQYEESDWAFLKRLAGYLNTVLVPSCKIQGEKYFFGIPQKKAECDFHMDSYTVRQEGGEYSRKRADNMDINRADVVSYIVESREAYELGDQVSFNGSTLYIVKIETILKGNELNHKYYLKTKRGIKVPKIYHDSVIGLSLLGSVEKVEGEQVKLNLQNDENKHSGNRWFLYSTVYSSQDGTGWYCMPEIGDQVRLYFPSEDENDAYVTSSVHENQGNGVRTNPDHKIWRNKEGKEIRLTPDKVLLTNHDGMSVELSDHRGIKIRSNKSVSIKAVDSVNISSSNASLEFHASNRILLKQGKTTMEISDGIHLAGAKVNLQ